MATLSVSEFEFLSLNLGEQESETPVKGCESERRAMSEQPISEHVDKSSNQLAAYVKGIRELALKCDDKLKIAIDTAEENTRLRAQVQELKSRVSRQQERSCDLSKKPLMWTDLLSQASKLSRKDRVLLVQSIAGQLGMIAQFPRNQAK